MVDIIIKKSKSKITYQDLDKITAFEAKAKYKLDSLHEVEAHMRHRALEAKDQKERRDIYQKFWKKNSD